MDNTFQIDNAWVVEDIAKTVHHVTNWQEDVPLDVTPNGQGCSANVSTQEPMIQIYNGICLYDKQVESTCIHAEKRPF